MSRNFDLMQAMGRDKALCRFQVRTGIVTRELIAAQSA
jgi:hypothetical protein